MLDGEKCLRFRVRIQWNWLCIAFGFKQKTNEKYHETVKKNMINFLILSIFFYHIKNHAN